MAIITQIKTLNTAWTMTMLCCAKINTKECTVWKDQYRLIQVILCSYIGEKCSVMFFFFLSDYPVWLDQRDNVRNSFKSSDTE